MGVDPVTPLRIKIFADGASLDDMRRLAALPIVRGFTTNPTLMRKAGVSDYARFAHEALELIDGRPISFEVLADDFCEMERQAREIARWGANVYVKIPISDTRGRPATALLRHLSADGLRINVTAIMTMCQVASAVEALAGGAPSNISIFAGRIADTGRDPMPIVCEALAMVSTEPAIEVIWASPREVLNVEQADCAGCHIITLTTDLLNKLALRGRNLDEFSRETVQMFYDDAVRSGFAVGGVKAG
jgi:transaldolase